ncbi:HTH-type transcriptional regulator ArgP [Alphaproteobacteria bacterium SO-S41]|nr:HTH-type transcriptional regulator ArgP [Alphaproteobacteria bacterium SO-S41]
MELRQLRYFKTIADARSFVRGAQHLNVAQPALSRSIAKLEDEIGQLLFVRHNGGVSLTDAGTRFYEHACNVLRRVQMLRDDMAAEMGVPHGIVALGMPASLQSLLAAPVAAAFMKAYPGVTLNVVLNTSINLRDALTAGLIDIAVLSSHTPARGLRYAPLFTEGAFLVQRADAAQSFDGPIEVADLVDMPLLLCGYPNSMRLLLEDAFAKLGARPDFRCEVNASSLLMDLVEQGAGAGIVPSSAVVSSTSGALKATPIKGLDCSWSVATSFDRIGSASVNQLNAMIFDHMAQMIDETDWPTARLNGGREGLRNAGLALPPGALGLGPSLDVH